MTSAPAPEGAVADLASDLELAASKVEVVAGQVERFLAEGTMAELPRE